MVLRRYYPYYGRGYVQLTHDYNYAKYQSMLGCPLSSDPDIAMRPEVALLVLVDGFRTGGFTGRPLTAYISAGKTDYVGARLVVNFNDQAEKIAGMARGWEARLATLGC